MTDDLTLAQRDGERGRGGCAYCASMYEIVYVGQGLAHVKIAHEHSCPVIAERDRRAALEHRDPGDEQPEA